MAKRKTKQQDVQKEDNLKPKVFVQGITPNHKRYLESIDNKIITVCDGPSGSGKTYMAVGMACKAILAGKIDQILVTRSIVGCGKELGSLPGDLSEKIHPYMLPTLEYFYHFFGNTNSAQSMIRNGRIKLTPVEMLRGHTFKNSFMILEEAQNCTPKQLKLFMSRIGEGSTMILSGDVNQRDQKENGMEFLLDNFGGFDDLGIVSMDYSDIVRHPIIGKILEVFDKQGIN